MQIKCIALVVYKKLKLSFSQVFLKTCGILGRNPKSLLESNEIPSLRRVFEVNLRSKEGDLR